MIDKMAGWLNFFLLTGFYYGIFSFVRWLFSLEISNVALFIICLIYAGGYLAKWRQTQGGGWSFK